MIPLRTRPKALWVWENFKFLLQDSTHESQRYVRSVAPEVDQEALLRSGCSHDSVKVLSRPSDGLTLEVS